MPAARATRAPRPNPATPRHPRQRLPGTGASHLYNRRNRRVGIVGSQQVGPSDGLAPGLLAGRAEVPMPPTHSRYTEMPLQRLPPATARRLIAQLYAPEQRFARCFHRYWREVMGQSEAEAAASTRDELAASAAAIDPRDSMLHTIG